MSDSDDELELLNLAQKVRIMGEHETKTSPLVTRDAVLLSDQFGQRGVLGTVLSVHADGIPGNTIDPRIYLNLNAPSSGLVCGVQGSGKSHTVSCILESSLISSRQIGTLPAPLGTVVFHFDEENGERPCEAAYLSELKDGTSRGVSEVVVLVSPSNIKTRRRVYSGLKFVQVEPLRIAEQDLNAARMLSLMGADNLETMPLYMHTILSILREMGSDEFNYRNFRKRLDDPEFNKSQSAMLELRLDLLDSFLQGNGPDVKSFFKSGRLVIIDVSDPFVESTTAAMLFDICLGLFTEWKSPTGKLIVLDEAHKYLTNSDANRFTKSICSIIRQQRHLAARVIVSTQEPTVVPASVLDLLSWIICHRFSSPSWVMHLKNHICVEEEAEEDKKKVVEWGKRVMMLRTGEAILYSAASLFATANGETAPLGTGYAVIMTRPRLTSDGGASLLATEPTFKAVTQVQGGLLTPNFSETLPSPALPHTPPNLHLLNTSEAAPSHIISAVSTFRSVNPAAVGRHELPASSVDSATASGVPSSNDSNSHYVPPNPINPVASFIHAAASRKVNDVTSSYALLIRIMSRLHHQGHICPPFTLVGAQLRSESSAPYPGKLKEYLQTAKEAGIVTLFGSAERSSVALVKKYILAEELDSSDYEGSDSESVGVSESTAPIFLALLSVIKQLEDTPRAYVSTSVISLQLAKRQDGDFRAAGYRKIKLLVEAAESEGLVQAAFAHGLGGIDMVRSNF